MQKKAGFLTIMLGCWMVAGVLTFLPLFHNCSLILSDLLSGFLLIACGFLCITTQRLWPGWTIGILGIWLQFAPLVFWAVSPWVYLNDTLIGAIAIVFAFLITKRREEALESCPKGWSYNPSSWKHRLPTVGLATLCWFFARYMAAYQLGYISHIWDPFFSEGTLNVITSNVSRAFPVSDAGLGAFCYTLEALLGWQGDQCRWATRPWLVFSFAFLVIPVGAVSIILIILQPIIVGAWCSWCLATALCMLFMIVLTAGEFVAALQFLLESKKQGQSVWQVFWKGIGQTQKMLPSFERSTAWGISIPWTLIASALLGLGLMVLPSYCTVSGKLATSDYIEGPIIFALSVIAMAEVFRALRYCLFIFAIWLVLAPWILSSPSLLISLSHLILGILLGFLSFPKGDIKERYGFWQRFII